MSQITLIRHGQANTTATDEQSYDNLSDLGRQQTRWLGEYMRAHGEEFDRVYAGSLNRQQQSAQEWGAAEIITDERLNEFSFYEISNAMHAAFDLPRPTTREEFIAHMPLVFSAWQDGHLVGDFESFHSFQSRVDDALHDIAAGDGRAAVFTSGGIIGMAVRVTMGLDTGTFTRLMLSILNSSVHRIHPVGAGLTLTQFNAIPHLEARDRHHAQTYI
ncbi:histidine phosphatase family protein [Aliiroseovarius subalbicans]|uniref:histidine phosphatase family protein n=1 Tax=Aliiroseovarius subalbicans TaxID=2925840 RepID=UPI001F588229|nr:histidine phosphatase family protein [Aliiroseovarius subalbicans]MCI2399831.1 histidine phosphatase family protein [Aliiroseovarius subalbicans]